MRWTKTKPAEPGHYWATFKYDLTEWVVHAVVLDGEQELTYWVSGYDGPVDPEDVSLWSDVPIPKPEED